MRTIVQIAVVMVMVVLPSGAARSQGAMVQDSPVQRAAGDAGNRYDAREAAPQSCMPEGLQGQHATVQLPVPALTVSTAAIDSETVRHESPWYDIVGRDAIRFCRAGLSVGSAPARWGGRDLIHAAAIVGLTGVAALADNDMKSGAMRNRGVVADRLESVGRVYGEGWVLATVAGGAYGAGLAFDDTWVRETAFLAGTSLLLTSAAARVLKIVVGRGRPYYTTDPHTFRMFSLADAYNAFPSGHSVAAFSMSAVLAYRIDNVWATLGLYGLATMTALSRVYADEHWFSDVVFGALFSTALTRSVISWYESERSGPPDGGFRVMPTTNGVLLTYEF